MVRVNSHLYSGTDRLKDFGNSNQVLIRTNPTNLDLDRLKAKFDMTFDFFNKAVAILL